MSIAIIGAGGQLGSDLLRRLDERAVALDHRAIEITSAESVSSALDAAAPAVVINCAAYNLVDQAEVEPQQAFAANANGPRILARECARRDIPLVHISTDYVFGLDPARTSRPYCEEDLPGPLGVYGVSKLAGEAFVRCEQPRHLVIRTCGLYGRPGHRGKGNFVRTVLDLAARQDELRVVDDQRCTPTSTADLADAILELLPTEQWGTFHVTNGGECSWYEFAREILRLRGLKNRLAPVATTEFPRPARRPAYSVLDGSKLEGAIGRRLPDWQLALQTYLAGLDE